MTAPDISQVGPADPAGAGLPLSSVRASDAYREVVVGVLREAFAEGRLTAEEHGTRVGQAYAARAYAELAAVSADLPGRPSASSPARWSGSPAASLAPPGSSPDELTGGGSPGVQRDPRPAAACRHRLGHRGAAAGSPNPRARHGARGGGTSDRHARPVVDRAPGALVIFHRCRPLPLRTSPGASQLPVPERT